LPLFALRLSGAVTLTAMATSVLSFDSVTKSYGSRNAVDGLGFEVAERSVTGLLGANGAGKSTTMKLLLGLATPNSGQIELFGALQGTAAFADAVRRTGSHIELPALYERATARQNIEIQCAGFGIGRRDPKIDAVLETVGLSSRSSDKVKSFSLGMRQRMSLALALVHEPELVVLDEPINGLDPEGVVEMRELIRSLPARGMTALVSSHVLDEIERTVDEIVIIREGKLIAEGPIASIITTSGIVLRVPAGNGDAALAALSAAGVTATAFENGEIRAETGEQPGSVIAKVLADAGVYPDELRPQTADLESVFLDLTATGEGES
jgi:ABC-2 type transport system ATP-binding protein